MRLVLQIAAFLGIVFGKMLLSFRHGYMLSEVNNGKKNQKTAMFQSSHNLAIEVLGRQNEVLINHLMTLHSRLMEEVILADDKKGDDRFQEISCRGEDMETIRKYVDAIAEGAVKETAAWASSAMSSFNLTLDHVSMEVDPPSDRDRAHDISVIFHVVGTGENALRFQAEASRKLKALLEGTEVGEMLRVDVRWK